ncbi:N-acetyltransferase [Actinotalea sp. Marseille-Q4924]|uniref:GNAT family N-acetyltransferase n=1 Tax=Actinotalea sp. Marseille-Q4924 TaxID=2866571 RepID=UPI001CE408C9|nr:GNAT family N-acetyltransferase [Actinotalea sp. Marseille-Q4924]
MAVRRARPRDTDRLYEICLRTGDAGQDATEHYADPQLLGDVYVGPYLALSPELAFVLTDDDDDTVVGYVVGVADTLAFERRCEQEWWPRLRADADRWRDVPAGSPDAELLALVRHPERTPPSIAATWPAHLHIDLLPRAQGRGGGRRLVEHLLAALRVREVPGVMLGVDPGNQRARAFYRHLGFEPIPPVPAGSPEAIDDPDAAAGHLLGLLLR